MVKGHEPATMTPAAAYGEEPKMRGKTKSMHRTHKRKSRRKTGKRY